MEKKINVVGYIRVSTHEQATEGYSLEAQEKEIREHCIANGYNLLDVYCDAGITGTSVTARAEFQKMMRHISSNTNTTSEPIHYVLIWKLSRISRNISDLLNIFNVFEANNVQLKSINENLDTSNTGKIFLLFAGLLAEMERDNIVANCKMGMQQRASQGKWNGGRVFGYRSDSTKKLVIHQKEAEIVKDIFRLFSKEKWGYKKIATWLNNRGYTTLRNAAWSINGVKQVIDNPVYAGFIRWGQHKDWSKNRRKGKTKDYVLVKGEHLPIIEMDVWEATLKIRETKSKKPETLYPGEFLLTSLLKCPQCGASMVSHKVQKKRKPGEYYNYYACSNYVNKGINICRTNLVNAEKIEQAILQRISTLVTNPSIIKGIILNITSSFNESTIPLEKEATKLKKELAKIEEKKVEGYKAELEGNISLNILSERLDFLNKEEDKIRSSLANIEKELASRSSNQLLNSEVIHQILSKFMTIFSSATIEMQKQLLHSLIDHITIHEGDNIKDRTLKHITLKFEPQAIEALSSNDFFEATYDTVLP
ncbi:recombinase family protein [Lysinibacillus sphaericus]|uniref:recombinase family protein n=1 Tax=Lysinibacillus sphaericus TaxID=1421 RepID=UPI003D764993